jgi:hypothetical protein
MSMLFIIAIALLGLVALSHAGGSCKCSEGKVVCSCGNGEPQECEESEETPATTHAGAPMGALPGADYIIRETYCECDEESCLFANNCFPCCKTRVTDCSARVCLNGNLYMGKAVDDACQMSEFGCTLDCCKEYCSGSCGECKSGGCVCNYACMTGKDCGTSKPVRRLHLPECGNMPSKLREIRRQKTQPET